MHYAWAPRCWNVHIDICCILYPNGDAPLHVRGTLGGRPNAPKRFSLGAANDVSYATRSVCTMRTVYPNQGRLCSPATTLCGARDTCLRKCKSFCMLVFARIAYLYGDAHRERVILCIYFMARAIINKWFRALLSQKRVFIYANELRGARARKTNTHCAVHYAQRECA